MIKYTKDQIRFAVDIVIGDDGFRSKEVIEILETEFKNNIVRISDINKKIAKEIKEYRFAGKTYKNKSDAPISDPRPIYKSQKIKKERK
tara:strand:- start:3962 stop:4228 length:267 start_codon:yes stop_codon:yes gene_type:complete